MRLETLRRKNEVELLTFPLTFKSCIFQTAAFCHEAGSITMGVLGQKSLSLLDGALHGLKMLSLTVIPRFLDCERGAQL